MQKLEKLTYLNGFRYSDLAVSRQRRFNRITLRLIELTEQASEETRRDMFERINSGSVSLNAMENRRWTQAGKFMEFVDTLAKDEKFIALTPMSDTNVKRFARQELVCRFFAFYENYENYGSGEIGNKVSEFVDKYVDGVNEKMKEHADYVQEKAKLEKIWNDTMNVVTHKFPYGFAKSKTAKTTPNVRFDSIAVGTAFALRDNPSLAEKDSVDTSWLNDEEFKKLTTSDAANNKSRVTSRITYVRTKLNAQ